MEIGRNYLLLQIFPEGSLDKGVEEVVSQYILQMVLDFKNKRADGLNGQRPAGVSGDQALR